MQRSGTIVTTIFDTVSSAEERFHPDVTELVDVTSVPDQMNEQPRQQGLADVRAR